MKKTLSTLALATAASLAAAPAAAAIVLAFTPSATHINVGESMTIKVSISGLDAEVLSGFDLNFLYNASALTLSDASYSGAALGMQTPLNFSNVPGNAGFDVVSLDDDVTLAQDQPNTFDLFSFLLTGAADGTSNFTLGNDPDFDRAFSGIGFNPLTVDVGNICISVGSGNCSTAIPEPGTTGLVGLGLLSALLPAAFRFRRKV